jgi:16S rRNA (guanine(966)-N(2))-methyltransferase RsmD
MRVISGIYKGRRLKSPRGNEIRPTPDRLKESLFNILQPWLPGCRFLDLCAGTGSAGIEAMSRGARQVTFIERSRVGLELLKENLKLCGIHSGFEIMHSDALLALTRLAEAQEQFDIIFFDPPYASELYGPVLEFFSDHSLLNSEGVLIVMHHNKRRLGERYGSLLRYRELKQGENALSFYRVEPEQGYLLDAR